MKSLLNKKSIICFLFLLPCIANAQVWEKIIETPERDIYIDKSSVKRNGSTVTYWSMHNKKLATLVNQSSSDYSSKYKVIQDCKNEESKMVYFATYDKPMGEGKVVESGNWDGKPTPTIPGSVGYIEMKYACNSNRNSK